MSFAKLGCWLALGHEWARYCYVGALMPFRPKRICLRCGSQK